MNGLFKRVTRLPLLMTVLLLVSAALLACGPSSRSQPEGLPGSPPGQQDGEGVPESVEEEGPKYTGLDATFRQIVQRFEDGELSEAQAAALAPDHFESLVMVTVDVSSNLEAIDDWLSGQGVGNPARVANPNHVPMYINAWVPVSMLGPLSQRDGVMVVSSTYDYLIYYDRGPGRGVIQGDPVPPPKPTQKYPSINDPQLQMRIVAVQKAEEARNQGGAPSQEVEDSVVDVEISLTSNTLTLAEWLRNSGVDPVYARKYEDGSGGRVEALVPLSLLGVLAEMEEVVSIEQVIIKPWHVDKE